MTCSYDVVLSLLCLMYIIVLGIEPGPHGRTQPSGKGGGGGSEAEGEVTDEAGGKLEIQPKKYPSRVRRPPDRYIRMVKQLFSFGRGEDVIT